MNKFWCIWKLEGGHCPTMKHTSETSALEEAARLIRKTGGTFAVLEVVGHVAAELVPVMYTPMPTGKRPPGSLAADATHPSE